jgi:ankyrin repeat protein
MDFNKIFSNQNAKELSDVENEDSDVNSYASSAEDETDYLGGAKKKKTAKQIGEEEEDIDEELEKEDDDEVPLPPQYNTDPRKILEFLRACQQGNIEDINRLINIKDGINPSSPENRGLIIASSNGNLDVVNLLLRNDLVNSKNPSTFIAAATAAISNVHLDVFDLLLRKIEKVKLSDSDKNLLNRPLIIASDRAITLLSLEYSDISDRLIKLGADRSVDRRPRPGFSHKNKKSPKKVRKSIRKSARKTKKSPKTKKSVRKTKK